jgi:DNA-binding winged helix-turn-helix (wHTH) protein/TolB-like protein
MPNRRFGLFDFNPDTGELFREGRAVRLQAQPARLLALLIAARGGIVTRESLHDALWPDGTTVDFDRGLNFAIAQVRSALGDSAESPAFIRTVPKRGYQFIAPLSEPAPIEAAVVGPVAVEPIRERRGLSRRAVYRLGIAAAAVVAAITIAVIQASRPTEARIAVARFENETGNLDFDRFAGTITDSVVASLTSQTAGRFGVIGNAMILRRARSFQDLDDIASTLKAEYVILGQVQRDGPRIRVLAHLIRMPGKTHLKVSRLEVDSSRSEAQSAEQIVSDLMGRLNSLPPVIH